MPEDTTATTTTAATTQAVEPATTPQTQAVTPPEPQAGDGNEPFSFEEAKKLRSEAQNLRKRLKAIEDQTAAEKLAQEEATMSEVEKSKKRVEESNKRIQDAEARNQQLQQKLVASEVKIAAQAQGFHNPARISALIKDDLEYGEDGMPSNLDRVLTALAKSDPYLLAPKASSASDPAQTVTPPAQQTPTLPAMNPGRGAIAAPAPTSQGKPYTLSDFTWSR